MFCSKCGTETPDDSQFCRRCGKGLSVTSTSSGAATAVAPAPVAAKPKPKVRAPFMVAGVLILIFVLLAVIASLSSPSHKHASAIDQLVKQKHTLTIDKSDAEVSANGHYSFKLEVP